MNATALRLKSRYTEVAGYRIHSVHAGSGPHVVLLHGLSGSHRWWRHSIDALAPHVHVHVPELIGFGASRAGGRLPSISDVAAIVAEWMDALNIEAAAVTGHSMGGQIAIHLAASRPARVRRLALVCAAGIPRPLAVPELARFVAELVPPAAWGRKRFLPTIALDAARAGPRVLWQATRHILSDDIRALLPGIEAPTLVIWGARDPLTPLAHAHQITARIRGARLVVIEDAAHVPMVDRPAVFNPLLLDFVREP